MAEKIFPKEIECPACETLLVLDNNERLSGTFACPECDEFIQLYDTLDLKNGDKTSTPPENISVSVEGLGDEVLKGVHRAKSYVGTAFLTLLFYYVGFYFIGLICNLVFISQANSSRRIAGTSPSGRGCLLLLLWIHLIIPLVLFGLILLGGGLANLNY